MLNLLLLPVAAFLILWSTVITFNRAYVDDVKATRFSWFFSLLLLTAAMGLVYVAGT